MILGIGIDSAQVERFGLWKNIGLPQLKKVFSEEEIAYCLKVPRLSAQRFAVRFAVREAFFKALCAMQKTAQHPFLKVCKAIELLHTDNQIPVVQVNWDKLIMPEKDFANNLIVHCSLTHTSQIATAVIVIDKA